MASGWVKSLQCKSRAFDDVVCNPKPRNLIPSASCRNSVQNIKDVIDATAAAAKHHHRNHHKPTKPKPKPKPTEPTKKPAQKNQQPDRETESSPLRPTGATRHVRTLSRTHHDQLLPALTELPEGHASRNVVEIIFHTSWSPKEFSGRVEMIFKVQNGSKAVARFEEYRELVKSRAGSKGRTGLREEEENARCVADGNEVMGFYCLGPTSGGGAYDACGGAWTFPAGKGSAVICTYSGSGGAHESAGGGRGMRAMLVCRVIAGRVSEQPGVDSLLKGRVGFDSVSGEHGELLVFDPRAVLPCFLIIYKL